MDFTVGSILEGKVQSIAKFGAFITLPDGQTGLVHISEIAGTFVKDIHDFLSEGQSVQVKVIAVDAPHRISLSIKQAQPDTARPAGAVRADAKPPVRRPSALGSSPLRKSSKLFYPNPTVKSPGSSNTPTTKQSREEDNPNERLLCRSSLSFGCVKKVF